MRAKKEPNQELLKALFNYKNGFLIWKENPFFVKVGTPAGYIRKQYGYCRIKVNKIEYAAHRLIWVWHNGDLKTDVMVDHVNTDRSDNRIENLRLCTHKQNMQNRKISPKNTTGYPNVHFDTQVNRYRAKVKVDGKSYGTLTFKTAEEAHDYAKELKASLHPFSTSLLV